MTVTNSNPVQARPAHSCIKHIDELLKSTQKILNDSFGKDFQSINRKLGPVFDFFAMAKDVAESTKPDVLAEKIRAAKEQRESYEELYGPDLSEDSQDRFLDLFIKNQEKFLRNSVNFLV